MDRRGALRLGCKTCMGMAGLLTGLQGSAQDRGMNPASNGPKDLTPFAMPQRFTRPTSETDEGGLWAVMDREERRLRRSPFLVQDKPLNDYLQDLMCRLTQGHCPDVRVYLVRTPLFNASMAPNGMMQVWTGLLLRVENEAQLAAVLGHEIGHYLERHTLERLRDVKAKAAFAQFLGVFGLVGALGQLGVLASLFAFSREQESRADRIGLELMQTVGFDPHEASKVWDNLLGELKVTGGDDVGKRSPMMATHPAIDTRREELRRLAGSHTGNVGEQEYQKIISGSRMEWLQDEVKRGQYEESLVLFDRLLQRQAQDPALLFARGEVYRLRAGEADQPKALADLVAATALDNAPAQAFRSLGLLQKARGDKVAAVAAFNKYLTVAPAASDAGLISNYVSEMTP